MAIVPRFATRSFLNIAPSSFQATSTTTQRLAVFDGLPVLAQNLDDPARHFGLDLVHHLHRFNDTDGLTLAHCGTLLDERLSVGR